ncbi:late embryogenesis abundant protein At1g64065-like [Abrus precatorius]|uniref:Late embryogenesis abundant protein At1g64065-like n=1 Tax=Abrus precatorius TaxID=3816 RepID=A0A8B8KHQ9_ABRPR|nr:late embryogenesis abundant protein At1g64065-like [Abrus precatorius]
MATRGLKMCLGGSVLFLIIVAIAIVTLFFTIFKPKDPDISVNPVGLQHFPFALSPNLTMNLSLATVITIGNPNYGSFEFTNSTGYVNFHDNVVADVPIGANLVPARSKINLNTCTELMVGKLALDPHFWSDVLVGTLNLTSTATLPGEARFLKIIRLKATSSTSCNISFNFHTKDVDSKCISKVKF